MRQLLDRGQIVATCGLGGATGVIAAVLVNLAFGTFPPDVIGPMIGAIVTITGAEALRIWADRRKAYKLRRKGELHIVAMLAALNQLAKECPPGAARAVQAFKSAWAAVEPAIVAAVPVEDVFTQIALTDVQEELACNLSAIERAASNADRYPTEHSRSLPLAVARLIERMSKLREALRG